MDDKMKHKAEEAKGKAKETGGGAAGDDRLAAEGRTEQDQAKGKQVLDDAAQKAREAKDKAAEQAKRIVGGDR